MRDDDIFRRYYENVYDLRSCRCCCCHFFSLCLVESICNLRIARDDRARVTCGADHRRRTPQSEYNWPGKTAYWIFIWIKPICRWVANRRRIGWRSSAIWRETVKRNRGCSRSARLMHFGLWIYAYDSRGVCVAHTHAHTRAHIAIWREATSNFHF